MFLYVLSESETDDVFYEQCAKKITGKDFEVIPRKLRPGSGLGRIGKNLRYLLRDIKYTGYVDNTFFIVSKDNDRRPAHPDHQRLPKAERLPKKEQNGRCRFCELEETATHFLGERKDWPVQGAISVPVQMKESWLLLIINKEKYVHESKLPLFSRKDKPSAIKYYSPRKPDDQLKDILDIEIQNSGLNGEMAFNIYCANQMKPDELAGISPSFKIFKEQIEEWILL